MDPFKIALLAVYFTASGTPATVVVPFEDYGSVSQNAAECSRYQGVWNEIWRDAVTKKGGRFVMATCTRLRIGPREEYGLAHR